jgi:serine/threonine-protein kinase
MMPQPITAADRVTAADRNSLTPGGEGIGKLTLQMADPAPSQADPTFESVALERAHVTAAQVDECREIQKKVAGAGLETSIEEILLKKAYLTRQQAAAINVSLGKGVKAIIDGYTILEKIAQGGMGAVYRARQTSMDRIVAIKVLLPKFAKEKDAVDRFLREAKAIARLSHPNIVAGIDAGFTNGIYYYAMEFVDGESMDKLVKREGAMHWSQALPVVQQVAEALNHAHAMGLVHRDIKPGNILRLRDGSVKLADLGLARMASGDDIYLTQTGVILGTPAYLSPEQARSERSIDIRSDLYSLGITLFEFLSGRPPFESDNSLVIVTKHTSTDVPVQKLADAGVPSDIVEVVRKMCARDRRVRYQSPEQLLEDLGHVMRGEPPVHAKRPAAAAPAAAENRSPFPPAPRPWVGRLIGALSSLLVLGIAIGLSYVVLRSGHDLPRTPAKPPADPGPDAAETTAAGEWDRVEALDRQTPDRFEEAIARYRSSAFTATSFEPRAKARVDELLHKLAGAMKAAEEELDRVLKEAEERGQFGAALGAAEKAAARFGAEEWKRRVAEKSAGVGGRAKDACDALLRDVDALVAKKDYDGAIARLKDRADGIAAHDRAVEAKRAEIEKAREASKPPPPPDEKAIEAKRLAEVVPVILQSARKRDFEAAIRAADELADELRTLDGKAEAQRYLTWLGTTNKFVRSAGDSLSRLRAAEKVVFVLHDGTKVEGSVVSSTTSGVVVRDRIERTLKLGELGVESLVWLFERPIDGRTATADRRAPAFLAILEGEAAIAGKYMDIVIRAGYEVPEQILADFKKLKKQ